MAMQKTLFKKYLRVSLAIILVSFLLLGVMLIVFISRYWEDEKHSLLNNNVENISSYASAKIMSGNGIYLLRTSEMQAVIDVFSSNIAASIFVTDVEGNTLLVSSDLQRRLAGESGSPAAETAIPPIPNNILKSSLSGGYAGTTNMNGLFSHPYYVVGRPIIVTNPEGGQAVAGVVLAASDAKSLAIFRTDVLRMFIFAAVGAFLVSFCVVGLFSYRMVQPLREMAIAARCFGQGDFSRRVPVTSQDEVGQLALAFNNMAASLASSESTRRSFIANVSHELKTPMTTIAGFIDGILDGTIPPDKQKHYLKIVSDEVKRLSRLVKTMLDLSRIDNGELRMNKHRFDLTSTVLSALITFETSINEKEIEVKGLEEAESLFIDGDSDMIHQVVYNLIENAVKFTNKGGYMELHVGENGNRALFSIKNSGQGIPADEIGMIFDKFYKTDKSRSQDKNGMGLGLYIVRTIIQQHGGDITVSSVEGEYCEFDFWVPKTDNSLAKGNK